MSFVTPSVRSDLWPHTRLLANSALSPAGDVFLNRGAQEATIEHADGTTSTVRIDDEEEVQQIGERNGKAGFD